MGSKIEDGRFATSLCEPILETAHPHMKKIKKLLILIGCVFEGWRLKICNHSLWTNPKNNNIPHTKRLKNDYLNVLRLKIEDAPQLFVHQSHKHQIALALSHTRWLLRKPNKWHMYAPRRCTHQKIKKINYFYFLCVLRLKIEDLPQLVLDQS